MYKVRLVAKSYHQQHVFDFNEKFPFVSCSTSILTIHFWMVLHKRKCTWSNLYVLNNRVTILCASWTKHHKVSNRHLGPDMINKLKPLFILALFIVGASLLIHILKSWSHHVCISLSWRYPHQGLFFHTCSQANWEFAYNIFSLKSWVSMSISLA